MLEIKSKKLAYGIKFPTSIEEITGDVLKEITTGIKLPKHYCIVALCFKTKLFDFVNTISYSKETNLSVTPLLANVAEDCESEINADCGDKLIIDRSSLERGIHLNLPISISSNNAANYFKQDSTLVKDIQEGKFNKDSYSPKIYVLEFKIVPIVDVKAAIPVNRKSHDVFIFTDKDE